jgi:hypothetical protein
MAIGLLVNGYAFANVCFMIEISKTDLEYETKFPTSPPRNKLGTVCIHDSGAFARI